MHEVYSYLQDKQAEILHTIQMLVEMESPSKNKELTDRLSKKIAQLFEELTGGTAQIIQNDKYGNHVRGEWGEGEKQILVLAHFDTVWPVGTIIDRPFRISEGKAFGPGVFDMKAGLVLGIYALHALMKLRIKSGQRVVFLFNSDEEIGSPTSRSLIEEEASKSEYVLVLECSAPNGAAKTMRKGVGRFHLKVTGKPAHSGVDHEKGISAIDELARQILYLHSLTDYSAGITVNVGTIRGGTVANVVAAEAEAEVDLRVATKEEEEITVPKIIGLISHTQGAKVEVHGGLNRPPFERTEKVAKLYEFAKDLAKEKLHYELLEAASGGASDGNFTAKITPTLDGLGAVGDGAHAATEFIAIGDIPMRSALIALILSAL